MSSFGHSTLEILQKIKEIRSFLSYTHLNIMTIDSEDKLKYGDFNNINDHASTKIVIRIVFHFLRHYKQFIR